MEDPMSGDNPRDIHSGGVSAWCLPPDRTCPSVARALTKRTLVTLGLQSGLVYDAVTAVSELSTNALEHGLGITGPVTGSPTQHGCAPELWIYHRLHPESQIVLKIFDPRREWARTGPPVKWPVASESEHGRGLGVVGSLFGGWSAHLSRSRVSLWPLPGKAVQFSFPIAGLCAQPSRAFLSPAQAARELHGQLADRGIDGVLSRTCGGISVVSVRSALTLWCHPEGFRWQNRDGTYLHREICDLEDVAEEIVRLHEELKACPP
jgi:anti-sigma regulatory factor (Ser/Thr protein kinase)